MKQPGTYLADILTEDGQIPKEQQSIYAYLFDYLIESLLYDIIVLIFGLLVHRFGITIAIFWLLSRSVILPEASMQIQDLGVPCFHMAFIWRLFFSVRFLYHI